MYIIQALPVFVDVVLTSCLRLLTASCTVIYRDGVGIRNRLAPK